MPGGVTWDGDDDQEYIFGTEWDDMLDGMGGNDLLYGFEGDDTIIGGNGVDRLFGDAGDDLMYLGSNAPDTMKRPVLKDYGGDMPVYGE